MLAGNYAAARVQADPAQKLYVFKFRAQWLVVDIPAGLVMSKCRTCAEALETAQTILDAAQIGEVCS